jgi:tetratricopeptide (TPR) repeat protein
MKLQLKIILAAALLALAAPVRGADAPAKPDDTNLVHQLENHETRLWEKLMAEGRAFTPEQVKAAETRLRENPKDLATRVRLMGFYAPFHKDEPVKQELWKKYAPLVLGIIEIYPESDLAGSLARALGEGEAFFTVPEGSVNYYNEGLKLWDKLMAANPTNVLIVGQAAIYRSENVFQPQEPTMRLFEKACELDPRNPRWPQKLGDVYLQQAHLERSPALAGKALAMLERAASLSDTPPTVEDDAALAMAAGQAEQWGKVFQYGTNAIARLDPAKRDWNYGNVVHDVNAMLCLAALHDGDKKLAGEYLLRAGRSPGSPQLNSFGPDFSYAVNMLKAGETNAVLQYLDLVGNFWGNTNRPKRYAGDNFDFEKANTLEKYRQDIRAGRIPTEGRWAR